MYSVGDIIIGVVFGVWSVILTYLVWKERRYLHQLFPSSGERDIRNKLKELLEEVAKMKETEKEFSDRLTKFQEESLTHMQKVAISRYNPYGDTGGDQSFSIVMMDEHLNGFVLTSLHSRAGTRVYIKIVKKGQTDMDLSQEEGRVLKDALKS